MGYLKVGIYPSFPVAYKDTNNKGKLKGIGVDIWKKIAKENNIDYDFVYLDNTSYTDAYSMVSNGEIQVLVGNVFSRYEKYKDVNFSRGYLRDTIQALMRTSDFYQKILTVAARTMLVIFGFIFAITLLNIILVAIDMPRTDWTIYNWIETSYKTAFVFATGDISITPKTVAGKIMVLAYAILGVIFVGIIAANFVNVFLTTANYINDLSDARKFTFLIRKGTISGDIARERGLNVVEEEGSYKDLIKKIATGEIPKDQAQGMIGNRLSMTYAQNTSGVAGASMGLAPYVFANLDYSYAINDNVAKGVTKNINAQIERMREEGEIKMIANRYIPGFL
jgi:ABC-type amino acid transport substrate-binding protein